MYENFTDRAKKVMSLAEREACRLGGHYVGTEHMLLGLLADGGGVAYQALDKLCVIHKAMVIGIEVASGKHDPVTSDDRLPLTPAALRALKLAEEEASGLGHKYIGTEHLLLGFLRRTDAAASSFLRSHGVNYAAARRAILALHGVEDPDHDLVELTIAPR